MKQLVYIVVLVMSSLSVFSQEIIIQPPLITPFECTEFYKLYTGMVNNFSQETFNTKLLLEVDYTSPAGITQRLADGILSGTPSVAFAPGLININNANYESIYSNRNITFYNKEIENLLSRTKCLPPGQYDVCLTLLDAQASDGSQDFLTQTCYTREKQMLTNLLLVSPFEDEEVMIDMPLFTWTPVTPLYPGAMYRIQIVEILINQTAFEALRSNPIFYEESGLRSNIFQYPVSARIMLPCTRYAWRITYELEGGFGGTAFQKAPDFLQESEVWEFRKPCDEEEDEEEEEDFGSCIEYHDINAYSIGNPILLDNHLLPLLVNNTEAKEESFSYQIINQNGTSTEYTCCWTCCGEVEDADDDTITERRANQDRQQKIPAGIQPLIINLAELQLPPNRLHTIQLKIGSLSREVDFVIVDDNSESISCYDYQCIYQLSDFFDQMVTKTADKQYLFDPVDRREINLPGCFNGSPFIKYYWQDAEWYNNNHSIRATLSSISADINYCEIVLHFSEYENEITDIPTVEYVKQIQSFTSFASDASFMDLDGETNHFTALAWVERENRKIPLRVKGQITCATLGRCCDDLSKRKRLDDFEIKSTPQNLSEEIWLDENSRYFDPSWLIDKKKN